MCSSDLPFADKLLTIAAFISLVQMDLVQAWMVAIIIGREFAVTGLRILAHARGATMPASPLGKLKMVAQIVAILALILGKDHLQGFFVIGQIALWVAVVTALVSAADYFRQPGGGFQLVRCHQEQFPLVVHQWPSGPSLFEQGPGTRFDAIHDVVHALPDDCGRRRPAYAQWRGRSGVRL